MIAFGLDVFHGTFLDKRDRCLNLTSWQQRSFRLQLLSNFIQINTQLL